MRTRLTQLTAAALFLMLCSCSQSPAKPDSYPKKTTDATVATQRPIPYGAVDLGLSVYWAEYPSNRYLYWKGSPADQEYIVHYISYEDPFEYCSYFSTTGGTSKEAAAHLTDRHEHFYPEYIMDMLDCEDMQLLGITDHNNNLITNSNGWRKPTKAEMEELVNLCEWECIGNWASEYNDREVDSDVSHPKYKVTGPNGKSIVLPTTGIDYGRWGRIHPEKELSVGAYWTATACDGGAFALIFNRDSIKIKQTEAALRMTSVLVHEKHPANKTSKAKMPQKTIRTKVISGTEVKFDNGNVIIEGNSVHLAKNAPYKWPVCVGVVCMDAEKYEATPNFKDLDELKPSWRIDPIISSKSTVTDNKFVAIAPYSQLSPQTKYYYKAVVTWQGELYFAENTESFTTPDFGLKFSNKGSRYAYATKRDMYASPILSMYASPILSESYVVKTPATDKSAVPKGAVDLGLSVYWALEDFAVQTTVPYMYYVDSKMLRWNDHLPDVCDGKDMRCVNYATKTIHFDWCDETIDCSASLEDLRRRGIIDGNNNLTREYDPVAKELGGKWRMPTVEEVNELITKCEWVKMYGNVYFAISSNDVCLSFEFDGGFCYNPAAAVDHMEAHGEKGFYWTSTITDSVEVDKKFGFGWDCDTHKLGVKIMVSEAEDIYFGYGSPYNEYAGLEFRIRPVCDK